MKIKLKSENPNKFLTICRLDLVAKILLAKKIINNDKIQNYEKKIYLDSINYINGFIEKSSKPKVGKENFFNTFKNLIKSIKQHGYNKNYPILIDKKSKKLVDGAHRLSTLIALKNKKVYFQEVDKGTVNLDYKKLLDKTMPETLVEQLVYNFCTFDKNTRIIFLWPNIDFKKNKSFLTKKINEYGEILYTKKILLTEKGKINLISNIYKNEKWVSNDKKFNSGTINKSFNCFKDKNFFNFFIIKKNKNLLDLKNKLRLKFKFGKHSIHTNDKHSETITLTQLLLNNNSLHNLNYRLDNEFSWHKRLHQEFKKWIKKNHFSIEDFCIEGSAVLSAYGLRESRDLDYLSNEGVNKELKYKEISRSNDLNKSYFDNTSDLINDPNNFFYFNGLKYLSLNKIKEKKQKRNESKDINDLKKINFLYKEKLINKKFYNFNDFFNLVLMKNRFKFYLLKIRFFIYKFIYYNN
jgi:hypothetical protein